MKVCAGMGRASYGNDDVMQKYYKKLMSKVMRNVQGGREKR